MPKTPPMPGPHQERSARAAAVSPSSPPEMEGVTAALWDIALSLAAIADRVENEGLGIAVYLSNRSSVWGS